MDTNTKNRFDSIALLWKGAWDNFNNRRVYEWKICLAIWTVFAIFIGSNISGDYKIFDIKIIVGIILIGGLITIIHARWIFGLGRANRVDREIAIHYERILQKLSNSEFSEKLEKRIKSPRLQMGKVSNWSHSTQIGITLLLYLASILIILKNQ